MAQLFVVHQKVAKYEMNESESVLVDVEAKWSQAARSIKLPQAHHESIESETRDEPPTLYAENLASVRDQVQPR